VDGISFLLSVFDFYFYDYWWIGELTGHNILSVIYMLFYAYYNRLCNYTVICIISLGILNILNIAHYFLDLSYYLVYAGIIIFTGIIFALIKWNKQVY